MDKPIDYNKRVYVYWNLHKKVWSIKQSGIVVDHAQFVHLKDCRFLVEKAGRQKVLREKKKNVHAGISGYLMENADYVLHKIYNREYNELEHITYNPYQYNTFVTCRTHTPTYSADYVEMGINTKSYVRAINPVYQRV